MMKPGPKCRKCDPRVYVQCLCLSPVHRGPKRGTLRDTTWPGRVGLHVQEAETEKEKHQRGREEGKEKYCHEAYSSLLASEAILQLCSAQLASVSILLT